MPSEDNMGIPVMRTPANVMATGLNSDNLASAAVRLHPVDRMQRAQAKSGGGSLDLEKVRNIYGSGLAMRLATERRLASQVGGRLLGKHGGAGYFTDSNAMLETVSGTDTTIDFGDVFNLPCDNPGLAVGVHGGRFGSPHDFMEHKLNL